jgi:plasmid stabilization system protein ParE
MAGGVVEYTPEARDELDELFVLVSIDTGPNAAKSVVSRLERTTQNLADFPKMGRIRTDIAGAPHSFAVHPWVLIYEPLERGKGKRLLRVIDGRRDLQNVLGQGDQC